MGYISRQGPEKLGGFWLEQQNKGLRTQNKSSAVECEEPTGHLRKVASRQEGPELRYTPGNRQQC